MTNADNGERDDDRPGARLRSMIRNWPDTDAPSQPPDPNWTDTDDPSVHPLWTERSKLGAGEQKWVYCPDHDDGHVGPCDAGTPRRRSFTWRLLDLIGRPA